jgi:hypothetical protein
LHGGGIVLILFKVLLSTWSRVPEKLVRIFPALCGTLLVMICLQEHSVVSVLSQMMWPMPPSTLIFIHFNSLPVYAMFFKVFSFLLVFPQTLVHISLLPHTSHIAALISYTTI